MYIFVRSVVETVFNAVVVSRVYDITNYLFLFSLGHYIHEMSALVYV